MFILFDRLFMRKKSDHLNFEIGIISFEFNMTSLNGLKMLVLSWIEFD